MRIVKTKYVVNVSRLSGSAQLSRQDCSIKFFMGVLKTGQASNWNIAKILQLQVWWVRILNLTGDAANSSTEQVDRFNIYLNFYPEFSRKGLQSLFGRFKMVFQENIDTQFLPKIFPRNSFIVDIWAIHSDFSLKYRHKISAQNFIQIQNDLFLKISDRNSLEKKWNNSRHFERFKMAFP